MVIYHLFKSQFEGALARRGYLLRRADRLSYLANRFGSDQGTQSNAHFYTRIYTRLFQSLRNEGLTIAEIGLLRLDVDNRRIAGMSSVPGIASAAPSLEMWREYFPNADIFGFDIDDFSKVRIHRCEIVRGDMSSRDDLARF